MNFIEKVLTVKEAADRWGLADITVRQACTGYKKAAPRFRSGEYRQSGSTWLITVDGMTRVFGPEKQDKIYRLYMNTYQIPAHLYKGYVPGMTIVSFEEPELIAEYHSKDEALRELAKLESSVSAVRHTPAPYRDIKEYVVAEESADEDDWSEFEFVAASELK
jgi:hypothetical protein